MKDAFQGDRVSARRWHYIPVIAAILTIGAPPVHYTHAVLADQDMATANTQERKPEHKFTNRLIDATSPYLLQHAHNPVDWHEWGPEALEKAKKEDRPIFLSIGYSACHWCHVMEHESFEHEDVAAVLNEHFVPIKVDREERPDLDEIYMAYTVQRNGHGGWPMSVWLTPDGTPFYAGTYYPKDQFLTILGSIADAWANRRDQITEQSNANRAFFEQLASGQPKAKGVISQAAVDRGAATLARYFDRTLGGMGGGGTNKFPPSMAMDLMLRSYRRTQKQELLDAVTVTLDHMARGGIYDHLGGGICRYSTDKQWLVPHFEKMLYDQALVSSIYLDAYQVTKNPLYAKTAGDIFDYVIADLQSPEGGFYSTRDADSGGLEGAYYIWTVEQVRAVLGKHEGDLFCDYYDVTPRGNWFESRGHAPAGPKNILNIQDPPAAFAARHGLSVEQLEKKIATWRGQMLEVRAKRVEPGLDDKILTGWNGLMIASLAKGARVLDEPRYADAAARAAHFTLTRMRESGRLMRTYRAGSARLTGYLNDYAFFIDGLLNLYEATFDRQWLDTAIALNDVLIRYYYDENDGAFFFTAHDAEKLIARTKNPRDGAIPSGNSIQASNLLRLAILLDRKDYREKAESIFKAFLPLTGHSVGAFERLFCAVDLYHDRTKEIAIVGDPDHEDTARLVRVVYDRYLPNKVVVGASDRNEKERLPLLKNRGRLNGKTTAYVCVGYVCQRPSTDPTVLAEQLDAK